VKKHSYKSILALLAFTLIVSGCASSDKITRAEKRVTVLTKSAEVLQQLYAEEPEAREKIKKAAGYGVFNNANVNLMVASLGSGYGVVVNNADNQRTYMNMAEAGIGFGAGVKNFSIVMIFHDESTLTNFIEQGWTVGAQADASAKVGNQGAAAGTEISATNMTIYEITQNGIALQLTVKGTKFWKDTDIN
jgi:lipid-binding SYLF domain-containing protein